MNRRLDYKKEHGYFGQDSKNFNSNYFGDFNFNWENFWNTCLGLRHNRCGIFAYKHHWMVPALCASWYIYYKERR